MRKPYPSDLTDEQWAIIEPLIPVNAVGRPREVDMREVSTPSSTSTARAASGTCCRTTCRPRARLRLLRPVARRRHLAADHGRPAAAGPRGRWAASRARAPPASTARRSRGPKSAASGATTGARRSAGVKRHIVVDTLGLLLVVMVTAASADDGTAAPEVLGRLTAEHRSRLEAVRGDRSTATTPRCLAGGHRGGVRGRGDRAPGGVVGFVKLPKRWVVERTFAWMGRYRRNSRDYELYPHERGGDQGQFDPSDAQAIETRSVPAIAPLQIPEKQGNLTG